jgi:hypothetical protein
MTPIRELIWPLEKSAPFIVRCSPEIVEALTTIADTLHCSRNDIVNYILAKGTLELMKKFHVHTKNELRVFIKMQARDAEKKGLGNSDID